ncbi:MAG: hypothetical protein AB7U38_14225 [Hyphomicrobiales bacterium]
MNRTKARQPARLPGLALGSLRATFGAAPASPAGPTSAGRRVREPLDEGGKALLGQLAGKLSLRETARDYPHVINRLAPFGYRPAQMVKGIDALLIDDRVQRQGFPFAVITELSELRAFYARLL